MGSRETILGAVRNNQPPPAPLPDISIFKVDEKDLVQHYSNIFTGIGGKLFAVDGLAAIKALINEHFDTTKRIVTTLPEFQDTFELYSPAADPHSFQDVELTVLRAALAVAENGAVWLAGEQMGQRILPFICQHLAVLVPAESIVPTMHEAYEQIGIGQYGFGSFIGGPSKTADIEQALVMGAHGPITMTVFIIN